MFLPSSLPPSVRLFLRCLERVYAAATFRPLSTTSCLSFSEAFPILNVTVWGPATWEYFFGPPVFLPISLCSHAFAIRGEREGGRRLSRMPPLTFPVRKCHDALVLMFLK